jgi:hypothetical protein
MDENIVRSRQKKASGSSNQTSSEEKEETSMKKRKQMVENYDFGAIQKVPANVQEIMNSRFPRLFFWELYFG